MPNTSQSVETTIGWQYSYDSEGRIVAVQDLQCRKTSIAYESHANGRIWRMKCRFPDGDGITHEFDEWDRRIRVDCDRNGGMDSVRYGHDVSGNITSAQWRNGFQVDLLYDTKNRVVSMSVDKRFAVGYVHDFLGRMEKIQTPVGDIIHDYQTGQRKVIRRLPNGVWTVWEAGADGRLESITHATAQNHILMKFDYQYRPDGMIREIREWAPQGEKTTTYTYDSVRQLAVAETGGGERTEYSYDETGNRTACRVNGEMRDISVYDGLGRMELFNDRTCSHYGTGNLSVWPGPDGERRFEYNALGLTKTAKMPHGQVDYHYDGDLRLIGRSVAGGSTRFLPDPASNIWRPLMALLSTGERLFYVWEGNTPLAIIREGKPEYLLHDHLGSVRLVVNEKGEPIAYPFFDAFGVPSGLPSENPLYPGFAGLFFDPLSELFITRRRSYAPGLGRFLQMDSRHQVPMGSQEAFSPYAYCGSDPVNRVDPEGRMSEWVWGPENALWQTTHNVLNTTYAKQYYAQRSDAAIASAQGGWGGASVAATQASMWDMIGGYIPGEAASQSQAYAQMLWSYLPIPTPVSVVRNICGVGISAAEGSAYGVFSSVLSLGGTALGSFANSLRSGTHALPSGQMEFDFVNPAVVTVSNQIAAVSDWIGVYGHFENVVSAWDAGTKNWNSPASQAGVATSVSLPTSVGGIYLRGAGKVLEGMGRLRGISLDPVNGRLILLSEERGEVALPPLRLEDAVTIFRSVYEKGQAPFVSIDPNPDAPHGPIMLTRHGEMTQDTYVGWVMFESDRVMKAYSLGEDNVTRQPVESMIEGYQSLLESGHGDPDTSQKIWERFWIVPASVTRRESTTGNLTLLDVPLRVMTQRMILSDGKLVPAPDDSPSPHANTFAEWFTQNYDRLADEAASLPPEETGMKAPVSFFHELRRVALITAIAERLRELGEPMPQWMTDHPVTHCHLARTTPAITAQKTGTEVIEKKKWWGGIERVPMQVTRQIYGGVNLAPDDRDVRTLSGDKEADFLDAGVGLAIATSPLLSTVPVQVNGTAYRALALPGNSTKTLGAFILRECDLVVPVQNDLVLRLERVIHSLFNPSSEIGKGWTLDLPRLEKLYRPTRRMGDQVEYTTDFYLHSPLNTISARFDKRCFVPEVNAELLVGEAAPEILGLASVRDERIGFSTDEVFFRDGRRWLFDESGCLAARIQSPFAEIYRRETQNGHRLTSIEGWHGQTPCAHIRFEYDGQGLLKKALASNGEEVAYAFNPEGELAGVTGPEGVWAYEYRDDRLEKILQKDVVVRTLAYNDLGQVENEWRKDIGDIAYQMTADKSGHQVHARVAGLDHLLEQLSYDPAFRPLQKTLPDGTRIRWDQNGGDRDSITLTSPVGDAIVAAVSDDGHSQTLHFPTGAVLEASLDDAGRLASLSLDEKTLIKQSWNHNGQPDTIEDESTAWRHEYRQDGVLKRVLITPPGNSTSFSQWMSLDADPLGRTTRVADHTGLDLKIGYDNGGLPSNLHIGGDSMTVDRDTQGRIVSLETSWGLRQQTCYTETGEPERTEISRNGDTASVKYDQGRPVHIRNFDGGETRIDYHTPNADGSREIASIHQPNGLRLGYAYDTQGRVSAVTCGSAFCVTYAYNGAGRLISLKKSVGLTEEGVSRNTQQEESL